MISAALPDSGCTHWGLESQRTLGRRGCASQSGKASSFAVRLVVAGLVATVPLAFACSTATGPADAAADDASDQSLFQDFQATDNAQGDQYGPDSADPDGADAEPPDTTIPDDFQGLLDLPLEDEHDSAAPDVEEDFAQPDTTPLCVANGNGKLEFAELPALKAFGAIATFVQNKNGTLAAVPKPEGTYDAACDCLRWDFSKITSQDEEVYDSVLPLESFWFGDYFPGGQFVQFFGNDSLGIYSLDESGLYLHGLASVEEGQTRIAYSEPVPMVKLPMKLGDNWSREDVQAEGLYEGQEYPWNTGVTGTVTIEHSFFFAVDKAGKLKSVSGEFDVWRLSVDLTMTVYNSMALTPVATQHYKLLLFLTECTGLVARVRSQEGELKTDFTQATEFRRWGGVP